MATEQRQTDYLIIGAGAMGMAFADVVFQARPDARIILADRRDRAGGHWVDAYPFVTLHQPAAFYGAPSAKLGSGGGDLASHTQLLAYYEGLMKRFLASGRVEFLPQTEYRGSGQLVSTLDADHRIEVTTHQRVVDATCMNVEVPAMRPPRFEVDPAAALIPINRLSAIRQPWERYVVIGGGKTGIDAVLYLLGRGVAAERIDWIVPNDAWLWNRAGVQPGIVGAELMRMTQAVVDAGNVDDVFLRLEQQGSVMRLDDTVEPTKWRCATVNRDELAALRRIDNVVRLGRVEAITTDEIRLEQGSLPTDGNTLHVDCTANGLARLDPRPMFAPGEIALQSVFMCQQVFSAALVARIALLDLNDEQRNGICTVVPHPEQVQDLPGCLNTSLQNLLRANRHFPWWLRRCRLNPIGHDSVWRYLHTARAAQRLQADTERAVERLAAA
ncbi:MAG: hypothetical protein RJQ08_07185 [Salinisphaeraceae bacterium]